MDFLKKNWAKLAMALLLVLGGVFFIAALLALSTDLVNGGANTMFSIISKGATKASVSLGAYCFYAAGIIFFFGSAAYLVLKAFDQKKVAKYVLLAVGVINTILVLVFAFGPLTMGDSLTNPYATKMGIERLFDKNYTVLMAPFVACILVFALIPLVKGIKKMICCCEKEAPKAAPAAPKAAAAK